MKRFVIAGGPCSGKTTLLEELNRRGYAVKPEIARGIIAAEQERAAKDPSYMPVLPWTDLFAFQRIVFERMLVRDQTTEDVCFFDYGQGDTFSFCIEGKVPPPKGALEAAKNAGYTTIFLLDQLPHYQTDGERKEDEQRARRLHAIIHDTYKQLGYPLVKVPLMPVSQRADFVLQMAGLAKIFKPVSMRTAQRGLEMLSLNKETFDSVIKQHQGPIIIDFWASYCGPCKTLEITFEKLAKDYAGRLGFAKLNIEENEGIAQQFDILGLPCLVVFNNGVEIDRYVGNFPEASIRRKIEATLAKITELTKVI